VSQQHGILRHITAHQQRVGAACGVACVDHRQLAALQFPRRLLEWLQAALLEASPARVVRCRLRGSLCHSLCYLARGTTDARRPVPPYTWPAGSHTDAVDGLASLAGRPPNLVENALQEAHPGDQLPHSARALPAKKGPARTHGLLANSRCVSSRTLAELRRGHLAPRLGEPQLARPHAAVRPHACASRANFGRSRRQRSSAAGVESSTRQYLQALQASSTERVEEKLSSSCTAGQWTYQACSLPPLLAHAATATTPTCRIVPLTLLYTHNSRG
jgi:hypothetical protein